MKTIRPISVNLSLIIISIVTSILVAEFALRFTDYSSLSISQAFPQYHFKADEELGYDISENFSGEHNFPEYPYKIFSNKYNCFDYERPVPENYILTVGDSYTWGYTPLEKKWTTRVEHLSEIFMLKCGITGFGTKQELIKTKRVVQQVGHAPKFIMLMYVSNDINDDLAYPQRTVLNGHLVNSVKNVDLTNGVVTHYSEAELRKRYAKYMSDTLAGYLRNLRYKSILYRLYRTKVQPYLKQTRSKQASNSFNFISPAYAEDLNEHMPSHMADEIYSVRLISYLDRHDIPWYNQLITAHKDNLHEFVRYSRSIGAELLLVDICGCLTHDRLQSVTTMKGVYYYDLTNDYPYSVSSRWEFDGHWNIQGNQEAANYIYRHYSNVGVF